MANEIISAEAKDRFTSRKFQLGVVSIVLSAIGLFTGFLSGEEFVDIIPMILMFYGASNVASQFAQKR